MIQSVGVPGFYEDGPGVTTGDRMGWIILDYVGFDVYSSDSSGVIRVLAWNDVVTVVCLLYF